MDRLHHEIFSALDALSSSEDDAFCSNFKMFVGAVERAFRQEEAWMEDLDFPAAAAHQEQHARLLGSLHNIHAQVMGGDLKLGRQVVDELLPQWMLFHISAMDAPFAMAMQLASGESELSYQPS